MAVRIKKGDTIIANENGMINHPLTVKKNDSSSTVSNTDIVKICKSLMDRKQIDGERAASIITGELRTIFIGGLDLNGDSISIDMLRYLDEVLFENIRYLISSTFKYTPNDQIKLLMEVQFKNVTGIIGYELDETCREKISEIIAEV